MNSIVGGALIRNRTTNSGGNASETTFFTMPIDSPSIDYEGLTFGGENNISEQDVWALGWIDSVVDD